MKVWKNNFWSSKVYENERLQDKRKIQKCIRRYECEDWENSKEEYSWNSNDIFLDYLKEKECILGCNIYKLNVCIVECQCIK